jgi:hypothetical protein
MECIPSDSDHPIFCPVIMFEISVLYTSALVTIDFWDVMSCTLGMGRNVSEECIVSTSV